MFKPFSNNIIFFDTEFTDLDIKNGELISIGITKMNGEELYLELEYDNEPCDWVKENILPNLKNKKTSKKEAIKKIKEFVGPDKPYAVAYVNQFDMAFFYKLIPQEESPFFWLPIDFASVLFALGLDPNIMAKTKTELYKKLNIDYKKYEKHNALEDAKLLKEVYLKLLEKNEIDL